MTKSTFIEQSNDKRPSPACTSVISAFDVYSQGFSEINETPYSDGLVFAITVKNPIDFMVNTGPFTVNFYGGP